MLLLSWILLAPPAPNPETDPVLRIDPLLLAEAAEVFAVISDRENPVWRGWDASSTPILFYLPGVQDVLVNHPRPPAGFAPLVTSLVPAGWSVAVKDGETLLALDGQNTSHSVAGVETLVVADPISNLRPGLVLLLADPRPAALRERELGLERLASDPYDDLGMIVHEAFHVHQARMAPDKGASEAALLRYPWLAPESTAGFALEGRALARALSAADEDGVYESALEWLAVRRARRASLGADAIAYEDGTEFNEGLAKYTEWKLSTVLEGREPGPGLRWHRDFRGFADLRFWRARLLQRLEGQCSGEILVNGDPFGSGALRFRLYYTGMAAGVLLDRLGAENWQERVLEPRTTLTGLVEDLLVPAPGDLDSALERARQRDDWPRRLEEKRDLQAQGAEAARAAAEAIRTSPALFTLDFTRVPEEIGLSFTPFGITRVDAERTIYGQIPLRGRVGERASFEQTLTLPALLDAHARTLQFVLPELPDGTTLARAAGREALTDAAGALELNLPGLHLSAEKARLRFEHGVVVVLEP